jgi:hypothetical protein
MFGDFRCSVGIRHAVALLKSVCGSDHLWEPNLDSIPPRSGMAAKTIALWYIFLCKRRHKLVLFETHSALIAAILRLSVSFTYTRLKSFAPTTSHSTLRQDGDPSTGISWLLVQPATICSCTFRRMTLVIPESFTSAKSFIRME